MISGDTLMGTSLMTFPVQGTGCFGPGNRTAVEHKGPGHPERSNHQSLFWGFSSNMCIAVKVKHPRVIKRSYPPLHPVLAHAKVGLKK